MKLQTAANPGRPAIASMLLMAVALGMLAVSSFGCGSAQGERPGLLVFAAASLADVLSRVRRRENAPACSCLRLPAWPMSFPKGDGCRGSS